jgi:predicted  nucleic acid-binding Zn-ribbon protein
MSRRQPGETRDGGDLKKEIKSLKRQLARANREIARLQGTVEEGEETTPEASKPKQACPKCASTDLGEISTPSGKTVVACRACKKWRSRPV